MNNIYRCTGATRSLGMSRILLAAVALLIMCSPSYGQSPLANQLGDHTNWDEFQSKWNKGNSGGYFEGQIVPHTFIADTDSLVDFAVNICLDAINTSGSAYGYVGLDYYDKDYVPNDGSCGGDPLGCRWSDAQHTPWGIVHDDSLGFVIATNAVLNSVVYGGIGGIGACDGSIEVGWSIEFTPTHIDSTSYFYFGARISAPGDIAANGRVVTSDSSSSNQSGVWKSRVESNADRTTQITAPEIALPVELVSFETEFDGRLAVLKWTTGSEENNAGFEIDHSANSLTDWNTVAFVSGQGTTAARHDYRFVFGGVVPGVNRFRLKQIDFDGSFEYSAVVEVTVDVPGTHLLTDAYPNPFNPQSSFSVTVAERQHVQVELFDALGRLVKTLFDGTLEPQVAENVRIDAGALPTGLYVYRASGSTFSESKRVMLVR